MQRCYFIDYNDSEALRNTECTRVYLGHETCESRLPGYLALRPVVDLLSERNIEITLVFPFLTDKGLDKSKTLIEELYKLAPGLEIAASDWGLLYWLSGSGIAGLSAGRLLTGQITDPRLTELLSSGTGTNGDFLSAFFKEKTLSYLGSMGIHRFEISYSPYLSALPVADKVRYTLHVPFAPVTVMRRCPGPDLDFNKAEAKCPGNTCEGFYQEWITRDKNIPLTRIDNALYTRSGQDTDPAACPAIDRVVIWHFRSGWLQY